MAKLVHVRRNRDAQWVEARIKHPLTPEDLTAIETLWRPERNEVRSALLAAKVATDLWPQHLHWNWARKAWRCVNLERPALGLSMRQTG